MGGYCSNGSHDRNDNVLLNRERSWIECDAEDLHPRHNPRPKTEEGKRNELSYNLQ